MRALTLALLLVSLAPTLARAQAARARVSRGGVDGVEMQLEGALSVTRGGTLRWLITAYEVRGLSELAPAAGATVHVATSLEGGDEAAEVTTDAFGHARVAVSVPEETDEDSFVAILRLVHANGIQRRYELNVRVTPREALEVDVARTQVPPGSVLRTFGRLRHRETGAPFAGRMVTLTLRDGQGRPLDAPAEVPTDPAGLFAHRFDVPDDYRGVLQIEARTDDEEHPVSASTRSSAQVPQPQPILVAVAAVETIVAPRARVPLDVVVRTPMGRPIEGATVTLSGARREDPDRRTLTDARGRARLVWTAPGTSSGLRDIDVAVTATREGLGQASQSARVRVAADRNALSFSVEGGSLSSLGGYLFARLVGADGRPAGAGVEVRAVGPRLPPAGVTAQTDASGLAVLDVTLPGAADASVDRCGGETSTAVVLRASTPRPVELRGCIPLDPDAAARVRVTDPVVRRGGSLDLTVDRVSAAGRAPVAISILTDDARAVASAILPATETHLALTLPDEASGLLRVRARPLLGAAREPVRGGVTAVWAAPEAPFTVQAELGPDGAAAIRFGGASGERSAYVVAVPVDEARALRERLRARARGPIGELRVPVGEASPDLIRGAIAAALQPDEAAPAVLRGGRAVSVPAPEQPVAVGLLRDPWRSRSRFVTGRLALIIRALEQSVAQALPERIEDVAVERNGRYRFNDQVLASVAQSGQLGAEGATGLGGDPLTIDQLRGFDAQIDYDHVARRITRERLFRLILALRSFVGAHAFDLPWSRLGDPSEWMRQLVGQSVPGGRSITRNDLVDGWGRPFALRAARGGRSRFRFVDPLGAWEIVSPGPDGRFGNGDDAWDPAARVLRSGTPYAEAVGEDLLVARLQGVELGRATVQLLQRAEPRANAGHVPAPQRAAAVAGTSWDALPAVLEPDPDALALRRPAYPGDGAGGALLRLPGAGGAASIGFDEEPRTWGAVVYAAGNDGAAAVGYASTLAGSPLIVEGVLPERLRTSERVALGLVVTNVTDEAIGLRLEASGRRLELGVPDELTVRAGEAAPLRLDLSPGARPGAGGLTLRMLRGESALRTLEADVHVVSGDHPLRLRAAGLVRGRPWRVRFRVPEDARRAAGRVVVLAPSALAGDPDLADMRERDPALIAFSDALAGRESDPAVRAALLRAQDASGLVQGVDPAIASGCAAVAWAGAEEHDEEARRALARLRAALVRAGGINVSDEEHLRRGAALLAAISAGGVPRPSAAAPGAGLRPDGGADPVAAVAAQLRTQLRRALRAHPEEPTLLARAAGALLLADPRDAYGRAMLERAAATLEDTADGGARVPPSEIEWSELESIAATAALAVAAHQVRQDELAERLTRATLGRDHVATRAGGETLFWLLAGGAYGALGQDASRAVVHIDGARREVDLSGGRAVIALAPTEGEHEVRVEADEGAAFVRVEAAMERPFRDRDDGPYTLALEGDAGDVATGAALELSITADRAFRATVVDLSLPAGTLIDETLRQQLAAAGGVERVEVREPGFLRIRLGLMVEGETRTIPLPLRWTVHGRLRGLGVVAYPLGEPGAMSAIAPRVLDVGASDETP